MFTGAPVALVGRRLPNIGEVIALIGDDVATICGCDVIALGGLERDGSLSGAALVVGVELLQPSGFLVLAQRLAMEVRGLPVQLAQARVGRVGHQALAAFGGRALATGLLVCTVAELLRAPRPLTMLLGT